MVSSSFDRPPPRKVRFQPKSKSRKPVVPKLEPVEDEEDIKAADLLRLVNENQARGKFKDDKKLLNKVQVAFGDGASSNIRRSFGYSSGSRDGASNASGTKAEKKYDSPWDKDAYCPVTLPLRKGGGDPALVDEKEFGESMESIEYDENSVKASEGLGLKCESEEETMLFLQLPASLPIEKRSATAEANIVGDSSKPTRGLFRSEKGCSLEEIPPGFMGKLLVYKSGMVKLKLGDMLYDVSPGSDCVFAQDVVAVNTDKKQCCVLSEVNKRAIVTPDMDSLLSCLAILD